MPAPKADELLTTNLAVVERAIAFAARRYRLDADDAEEFAAIVKLRLVENDYAILRAYEERSSFTTFISVVVQRMALDFRIHEWGKWHASVEAKRLGNVAVELEKLLRRDGRTFDDAVTILGPKHRIGRDELQQLAGRLPERFPRHRDVPLEEAESVAVTRPAEVEELLIASERRRQSERISSVMREIMARVPDEDRLILQMRFEGGMTVPEICRALLLDQKLTYRRIDRQMRELRRELERTGIDSSDVADLIGRDEILLHFDLGNPNRRPSIASEGMADAQAENSR